MSLTKKHVKSYLENEYSQSAKVMNLMGLAMRAGKLITGEELTIAEIRKQKAKLVFVATDASENTRKR